MRRCAALIAGVLVALAGCGEDEKERTDPFSKVDPRISKTRDRAAPRWEPVATLSGSSPDAESFEVDKRAIQWRARWRCSKGRLDVSVSPRPRSSPERTGARCPDRGEASYIESGRQRLSVRASGRWRVVVEQQVDTPLREPPLRAMRSDAARVLARGRFYRVERRGRGRAALYRLPGGRHALRFEDFNTSSNTDLFVWLSEASRPRTTRQAVRAPHREFALLKSTLGDQNYLLPRDFDPQRYRSIVIWCEPVSIVYTAASLRR
jgi:electron transfer DM13